MASKWSGSKKIEERFAFFPVETKDAGFIWFKTYFAVVSSVPYCSGHIASSSIHRSVVCRVLDKKKLPKEYRNLL